MLNLSFISVILTGYYFFKIKLMEVAPLKFDPKLSHHGSYESHNDIMTAYAGTLALQSKYHISLVVRQIFFLPKQSRRSRSIL